ncbi:helix-turn-helix transcriptional regulator [Candidatus Aerophobetes bacterium]|nr:helix-turn-helix transcriptional regulator [Candidatus Aerophobetes bacterium]
MSVLVVTHKIKELLYKREEKITFHRNNVKEIRLRKGLTQHGVGKKVNKSHWWVSRVERGLIKVSEDEKIEIAKALESVVEEIFPLI